MALAVITLSNAHRVMTIGRAVDEPITLEFFFLENRVQSENRSAAPPYVPQILLMHCTNLKPRFAADRGMDGDTRFPAEPPFVCTAHAMMPKTVPTVPMKAGHMNFSSLCGLIQMMIGRYRMM